MAEYFIVGGSSGIGRQLSLQLSNAGHHVYATYNSHPVEGDDNNLEYHPCNVLDDQIQIDFLPEKIDGMVYCPGRIQLRPFQRLMEENFLEDYNLQVLGAVKLIKSALPRLKTAGNASIVLFSTVAVQIGFPFHAQVAASKGAIEGLTRSLSAELAPGIRVNCIAPSLTDTPLAGHLLSSEEKKEANAQRHPLKRIGLAADMANMAEFLLSEKSGWMTGQVMHVDGGMSSIKS
jgi:NAD(P)-dependent dehydrogenase (short-subunit alcohol dehydrogenase family)